jgi:hypothetical protein
LNKTIQGNSLEKLKLLPDNSVDCCVTSPPYFGLRDYGTANWEGGDPLCDHSKSKNIKKDIAGCKNGQINGYAAKRTEKNICKKCGAIRKDEQIGIEETPEEYVAKLVLLFNEVKRVLKPTGTLWLNLGDSYAGGGGASGHTAETKNLGAKTNSYGAVKSGGKTYGLKPKDLIGIPWMVAFALRDAGWYLRSSLIWCLSGGTYLYVKSQKGVMPMMLKDMLRLNPKTVQLWNGVKWTNVLGWRQNNSTEKKYQLILRSGERIGCTENHEWPTQRGNIKAKDLKLGDKIKSCQLPEPEGCTLPKYLTNDALWFIGLYLAEGSKSGNKYTLQIAGKKTVPVKRQKLFRQ